MTMVVHDMTFKEEFSLFFGRGNGWRVALRVSCFHRWVYLARDILKVHFLDAVAQRFYNEQ